MSVKKTLWIVLLLANAMVLLGQLWPDGAPPFAHTANVVTLAANLLVFALLLRGGKKG